MSEQESPPPVVDDREHDRFVLEWHGATAFLEYEVDDGRLLLIHTEVPESLGGRGIGGRLVQAGVDRAKRDRLTVIPWCPFARRWLRDHSDAAAAVAIDWSSSPAQG
jgi:predicted GNAT family acetyltransferase